MIKNKKKYNRILLKISGEILQNSKKIGINFENLNRITKEIKEILEMKIQIAIMIGGGNLFRGKELKKTGIKHIICDQIGMISTIINGLILEDSLNKLKIKTKLMSAISIKTLCKNYNSQSAIRYLKNKKIVILCSGTGNPFFTTDSAACLRAIEIKSNIILKGTKVNGVYSSDPIKNPEAIFYKKITYKEIMKKELKVMDSTAFALAKDFNLNICVFNINKKGALKNIINGKEEGTLISNY